MPVSTLSATRLRALLPIPLSETALEDLLFLSKAELESRSGDDLTVSVTPDRLDLLSEAGLALHLGGASDGAGGLPRVREEPSEERMRVVVDPSVVPLRPQIAALVVIAPQPAGLDEGTLAEAIRFQELLHATIGRDRRAASLGIYPLERLEPPFRYALEAMASVRFVPLDESEEVDGQTFYDRHVMARRFGPLGRVEGACLTLRDSAGTVLSLPPVLNARAGGETRVGDRLLLLESTGTRARAVHDALGLLSVVFAGRGWSVSPVSITGPHAEVRDGTEIVRPRSVDLPSSVVRGLAGMAMTSAEVERCLARARLGVRPHSGGWRVEVPAWRPDLLTGVDVAEDVILSGGVRPQDGVLLPSPTRGRRRAESLFRGRVRRLLLGLGYAEPHTTVLVSDETVARTGGPPPIRLRNPVSTELAVLRDRMLLSHLEVLGRNTRHSYPQRFAEVGPVVVRAEAAEAGGETRYRAGLLLASDTAGFADVASVVDYVLRSVDMIAVREPADLAAAIPGRAARARVAGDVVAEMGEVHPRILEALGVPVPAAWAEVDLTGLWMLTRHRDSH
jgi:phenylalanyl-tRNA synthetase beta chain